MLYLCAKKLIEMLISELYELFLKHPVVTTDSRRCPPGSLFFAINGANFNGNDFAITALANGAAFAIVDAEYARADSRLQSAKHNVIPVENTLQTIQALAACHRNALATPVIAITGTNGKTTTKELIATVLARKYNVLYTQGNLNNHIGVPLTLLNLNAHHNVAVVEMGANHPCEIQALANIAQPNYGVITNVGYAHLEGFGSLQGVIRTKCELLNFITASGGTFFLNTELEAQLANLANLAITPDAEAIQSANNTRRCDVPSHIVRYGTTDNADVKGETTDSNPFLTFRWRQLTNHATNTVHTRLVGDYNLPNALAAIAVGLRFGVETEHINSAIAEYRPTNSRSQLLKTTDNEVVVDAYNANPSSMNAAINNFAAIAANKTSALILGDMLELGTQSLELHRQTVELINKHRFDRVILCGKNFAAALDAITNTNTNTNTPYISIPNTEALLQYLSAYPLKGFYILLKGSHGMHLEKTIDKL